MPRHFQNYLRHVRTISHALNVPAPEERHPALRRAKRAILKRHFFESRPRMFIQRTMVGALADMAANGTAEASDAMLWLFAYTFMLRVPSEALPAVRGEVGFLVGNEQAVIWLEDSTLVLRLLRRKNKPHGSVLKRGCTCESQPRICPVHVLWQGFLHGLPVGSKPWSGHASASANEALRESLSMLDVPRADLYRCHDLRKRSRQGPFRCWHSSGRHPPARRMAWQVREEVFGRV